MISAHSTRESYSDSKRTILDNWESRIQEMEGKRGVVSARERYAEARDRFRPIVDIAPCETPWQRAQRKEQLRVQRTINLRRHEALRLKELATRPNAPTRTIKRALNFLAALPESERLEWTDEEQIQITVRLVGSLGEQAVRDLEEFEIGYGSTYDSNRYWGGEASNLHRIEHLKDYSYALITMRDWKGAGAKRGERFFGGVSFRCYLVARDSTTGEAHILRVPPKFGNENTKFFGKFEGTEDRIQAAVAWTFSMEPQEYEPVIEA